MKFKYAIIFGVLAVLLYVIGVYLSGWPIHRCSDAVFVYVIGILTTISGSFFGHVFDL